MERFIQGLKAVITADQLAAEPGSGSPGSGSPHNDVRPDATENSPECRGTTVPPAIVLSRSVPPDGATQPSAAPLSRRDSPGSRDKAGSPVIVDPQHDMITDTQAPLAGCATTTQGDALHHSMSPTAMQLCGRSLSLDKTTNAAAGRSILARQSQDTDNSIVQRDPATPHSIAHNKGEGAGKAGFEEKSKQTMHLNSEAARSGTEVSCPAAAEAPRPFPPPPPGPVITGRAAVAAITEDDIAELSLTSDM